MRKINNLEEPSKWRLEILEKKKKQKGIEELREEVKIVESQRTNFGVKIYLQVTSLAVKPKMSNVKYQR